MYDEDDIPLTLEEQEAYNVNSLGQEVEDDETEEELEDEVEDEVDEEEIEEDTSIDYTEDPDSANLDLNC